MITSVRIHPAIGICRVGNSPDEFFIGPERPWDPPAPPGGFKDAQCRVKRQAARFRVFGVDENDNAVEITAADAEITWTVHLRNRKAVLHNPDAPPADMTIDPGPRKLDAPGQSQLFDTGTITFPGQAPVVVPLGEARTDADGRLIVLGGFGKSASPAGASPSGLFNPEWFDDVADGPVTATVKLNGTDETFAAVGAWVVVGPPKFAPELDSVVTLYDRMYDLAAAQDWVTPAAVPSYTQHIYPILLHAAQSRWVETVPGWAHAWTHPVVDPAKRQKIFDRLKPNPGGNMPKLAGDAQLTAVQLAWMQAWKDGNFTDDWAGPPAPPADITPDGLDRAALGGALGASYAPGIEVGIFTLEATHYSAPFRFDPDVVAAGDVTAEMSLPWQADFKACGTSWWPVPRPNRVLPQGEAMQEDWDRGVIDNGAMVAYWHSLGFVVQDGPQYVEVNRCDIPSIVLTTAFLLFDNVPQGPMNTPAQVSLPIVFEVANTGGQVTLEVDQAPWNPRLVPSPLSQAVGPTLPGETVQVEFWVTYETGPAGEVLDDGVSFVDPGTGQSWWVPIHASTAQRTAAAVALVLDRSGSMAQDRGDGKTKSESLRQAASIFVDAMLEGDGIAVVRYDHDAQLLQPVTAVGPADPEEAVRAATRAIIDGPDLDPAGATSIGDGVLTGRTALEAAPGFQVQALVVLTDGVENSPLWLADVAADIDARTYAVGLGTPQNTSAAALQALAAGTGGYLLVTGEIGDEQQFILQKYFLQILAGVSNAEVVLDPSGTLLPGDVHRIPFRLSDADGGVDVFLLTPTPEAVDFRLQTPNGFLMEPWRAGVDPRIRYVQSRGMAYYRIALPAELREQRLEREGTWHVVLTRGEPRLDPPAGYEEFLPEADGRTLEARLGDPAYDRSRSHPYPTVERRNTRAAAGAAPGRVPLDASGAALETRLPAWMSGTPYSVIVHAYSSVSLRCSLRQASREPGAAVWVDAVLTESGIPVADAQVRVEVVRPDGVQGRMVLDTRDGAALSGTYATSVPGIYQLRVRASGTTRRGHVIQRERTLTVPVWIGGDTDPPRDRAEGGGRIPVGGSGDPGTTEPPRTGTGAAGTERGPAGCLGWLMGIFGGSR